MIHPDPHSDSDPSSSESAPSTDLFSNLQISLVQSPGCSLASGWSATASESSSCPGCGLPKLQIKHLLVNIIIGRLCQRDSRLAFKYLITIIILMVFPSSR